MRNLILLLILIVLVVMCSRMPDEPKPVKTTTVTWPNGVTDTLSVE